MYRCIVQGLCQLKPSLAVRRPATAVRMAKSTNPFRYFDRRAKKGDQDQGLGRSRGGFSTKIHLRSNALGLPVAVTLSGGQVSDVKGYAPVMDEPGPAPRVLLADKGYDADFILADLEARGVAAVIPAKRNRKVQPLIDGHIYSLRG